MEKNRIEEDVEGVSILTDEIAGLDFGDFEQCKILDSEPPARTLIGKLKIKHQMEGIFEVENNYHGTPPDAIIEIIHSASVGGFSRRLCMMALPVHKKSLFRIRTWIGDTFQVFTTGIPYKTKNLGFKIKKISGITEGMMIGNDFDVEYHIIGRYDGSFDSVKRIVTVPPGYDVVFRKFHNVQTLGGYAEDSLENKMFTPGTELELKVIDKSKPWYIESNFIRKIDGDVSSQLKRLKKYITKYGG